MSIDHDDDPDGQDGQGGQGGKGRKPASGSPTPGEPAAEGSGSSGSIDVQISGAKLPKAGEPKPQDSGSIDVQISGAKLPKADAVPAAVAQDDSRPISSGKVVAVAQDDSRPISSGKVAAAITGEASEPRSKRIGHAARDAIDAGVSKLGSGIGTLGGGVSKLGEGVSKLGDLSRKVPVVGSSVAKIGVGITHVGESLHVLPQVARTRRGRLLIRSMIVGFVLVALWIAVIVGLQLHGNDTPDFRPNAERILVDLSKGTTDEIYEQASPRFQEMVRKERFIDDMTDLSETVGKFREITAVNDSLVTTGPSGRVGRVSLTVAYEKATCKVSVSLHYDQGRWKLLGIGVELPNELKITQAQREQRVKACKDPMDIKHCDVHQAADAILQRLKEGRADQVWDNATAVFQKQEQKAKFIQLQLEHLATLGNYRRIIAVSEAKVIGGTSATFDTLAEFDKASGVRTVFGFFRRGKLEPWKLRSFKIVLPMPRGGEDTAATPEVPSPVPPVPPQPSQPPQPPQPPRSAPRDAGPR